jgi:hypothetical protein
MRSSPRSSCSTPSSWVVIDSREEALAIEPAHERMDPDEPVIEERTGEVREALGRLEADVRRGRLL